MRLIGGAILFVPGILGFMHELRINYDCDEALHKTDLVIFVGLMVGGALVVTPSFGKTLNGLVVTITPFIPLIGGRRAGDLPATPPPDQPPKEPQG